MRPMRKSINWKRKHTLLSLSALPVATVLIFLVLPFIEPSEERKLSAAAVLEYESCYVLEADGRPLLYVNDIAWGSSATDISTSPDSLAWNRMRLTGCWIYRYLAFPVCRGHLVAADPDVRTDSVLTRLNAHADTLVARNIVGLENENKRIDHIVHQLYYYLDVHNVNDEGYNSIATLAWKMTEERAKRIRALEALKGVEAGTTLKLRLLQRYTLVYRDTLNDSICRVPCEMVEKDTVKRQVILQTLDGDMPDAATALYNNSMTADYISRLVAAEKPKRPMVTYRGETENGKRNGHGVLVSHLNNLYYDGMWKDNQRHGFGFALDSIGRLYVGEWKENKYQGERVTYTEERIYGIDVSRFQHEIGRKRYSIDWKNVRIRHLGTISKKRVKGSVDYPVDFVYIKCTEGKSVRNRYYRSDYAGARSAGFRVGSYHFFSLKSSAEAQALYFLGEARFSKGDFPPVLDVEPTGKQIREAGGTTVLFKKIRVWLDIVERRTGVRPILYVSQTFVNRYLHEAPDIVKNYRVWIARYGEYKPDVRLAIWQLSPDGRVAGIHGHVDINVFNGYRDEYEDFLDAQSIR